MLSRQSTALFAAALLLLTACNQTPTEEEKRLRAAGEAASLLNRPDPEALRMQQVTRQYRLFIEAKVRELDLPGAAYAIVKDGEVVSIQTYGYCEVNGKDSTAINEATNFRLASLSKGFASVLTGLLVDRDQLDWNDRVKDHLPKFELKTSKQTEGVTLRHTLSHTTGLREYAGSKLISQELPYSRILQGLRNAPIEEDPAQVYAYQNAIYSVINDIAPAVTGLSYEALLDSLIFGPLGMSNSSVGYQAMNKNENKGLPHTFNKRKGWKAGDLRKNWYNVAPAAGVNSCVQDMAIWLQAMLGHRPDVIPQTVLDEVFKPHIPLNEDSDYYQSWSPGLTQAFYGLGWRIFNYKKRKVVYHGGFVRGYRPEIGFCPQEDVGVVFLTNASKNDLSTACVHAFFEMYFAPKVVS